jgi:hypothetical protein
MKRILFSDGKEVGEISEWSQRSDPPAYKTFLGKTVLMTPANTECSFTSPKPVNRRSKLSIVEDNKVTHELEILKVTHGTKIVAKIKNNAD